MSGQIGSLGARSGVIGTTENYGIPRGESPGGIDNYTVCMLRSDNLNNELISAGNCDISNKKSQSFGINGAPKHDTMGGALPALTHPDGHQLPSVFAMLNSDTSIQFGGTDKRMDFSFMRDDYTIDYWVRLDSVTGDQYMFGFPDNNGSGDGHFACNLYYTNFRMGPMTNAAHGFIQVAHGLSTGTWYHIALVRHGDNTYLFKNGAILGTGTVSSQIDIKATGNVYWGASYANNNGMGGQLAEMRVSKGIARWTKPFPLPTKAYF